MGNFRLRSTVLLTCFIASSFCFLPHLFAQSASPASPEENDRPVLRRQSEPMKQYSVSDTPSDIYARRAETSRPEVAPGLRLPNAGHVWALDKFAGQPQLLQLKYISPKINNHSASNVAGAVVAPFIYKPKFTVELSGPTALVRLHDGTPAIFFVKGSTSEDAADPSASWGELVIVKLQVNNDRRIVSTAAFSPMTGKSKRAAEQIETITEKVGSGWYKIFPKVPLSPGEYAFLRMPNQANLFSMTIYDFAIDPEAPQSPNVVQAATTRSN
jgi:hypothetical protein